MRGHLVLLLLWAGAAAVFARLAARYWRWRRDYRIGPVVALFGAFTGACLLGAVDSYLALDGTPASPWILVPGVLGILAVGIVNEWRSTRRKDKR